MNWRYVISQLGLLFLLLSGALLATLIGGWLFELNSASGVDRNAMLAIGATVCIGAAIGCICWFWTRKAPKHIGRREALLLVALSWFIGAVLSALPYRLWAHWNGSIADGHPFSRFIDCYFEAMSGLTTTGATILGGAYSIEAIPQSLLLWRSATQWLGGLGIVVLFVAVLPTLGVGGKRLFRVEAPGPKHEGLQPHIRDTARVLLTIYAILTAVEVFALKIAGMTWFDSVCHTFTTVATAGFSPKDASLGHYASPAIHTIVIIFMILAGVNFGLYYQLSRKRFRKVLQDTELRVYLGLLLVGTAIVTLSLINSPITLTKDLTVLEPSVAGAIHHGVFATVSIQTTTGFCTSDFNLWPFAAQAVLVMAMFIGGSAGSTAGGLKVIRIWIALKIMLAEIEHVFRPQVVRPVRLGKSVVDDELKLATVAYILGLVVLFIVGAVAVMLLEQWTGNNICDFKTAAASSIACLFNIGPGLGLVGATANYEWMTTGSKLLLTLMMALGRLEVFAIIVLVIPRFWRAD
ncbi:MAG: TrkH family potassium uptake protein [Planctomycetes bacterium]|nr:TrkH family potassium uptake protein [Planctomycetota bacterium]